MLHAQTFCKCAFELLCEGTLRAGQGAAFDDLSESIDFFVAQCPPGAVLVRRKLDLFSGLHLGVVFQTVCRNKANVAVSLRLVVGAVR